MFFIFGSRYYFNIFLGSSLNEIKTVRTIMFNTNIKPESLGGKNKTFLIIFDLEKLDQQKKNTNDKMLKQWTPIG